MQQAPPGGFSNVSFGGEETQSQKFGGHNFNPKSQKSEEKETSASLTSQVEPEPESKSVAVPQQQAPPPVEDKAEQTAAKQDFRGRGGSSGGGTSSITFG